MKQTVEAIYITGQWAGLGWGLFGGAVLFLVIPAFFRWYVKAMAP